MSYQSELIAKINGLNAQAPASDLYLAAKSLIEIGVQDIPRAFTENVYARLLQADTTDPYEIGFLNKILAMLDAWAVTTGAFGFNGQVVPIKNGALITPPLDVGYVTFPTRQWVFDIPGSLDFLAVHGHELPGWIKERTLLRVRVWVQGDTAARAVVLPPMATTRAMAEGAVPMPRAWFRSLNCRRRPRWWWAARRRALRPLSGSRPKGAAPRQPTARDSVGP